MLRLGTTVYSYYRSVRTTLVTRLLGFGASAVLITSSVGGGLPMLLSQKALAAPTTVTVCPSGCSYTSLQDAVNSVDPGSTINIDSNLTTKAEITINKSVNIQGNGYTLSPNFMKTSNNNNAAIGIMANNVTINGLTENGVNGEDLHGINVYKSTGVNLYSVTLENNNSFSPFLPVLTYGLVVNGSSVMVDSLTTLGNFGSVDVDQGSGVTTPSVLTIEGVSHHSDLFSGIYVDDTTKDVHVIDANNQYTSVHLGAQPHDLIYTLKEPVEDVTSSTYYQTIQAAVNAAKPGDVIKAAPGTYTENVTVNKPLTIKGANAGIPGYSPTRGTTSTVDGNFTVTSGNVTINGFNIDPTTGSSILMQGNYANETITDNVIADNGYAVNFNTSNTSVTYNQINYGARATTGVEANSTPGNQLRFDYNHFTGNASSLPADITVIGGNPRAADIFVDGNVSTSGTTLVALFNTWDATISGNTSTGAQGSAVYLGGNDNYVNVTDNTIAGAITAVNVANSFGDGPNTNVLVNNNKLTATTGVKVATGAYPSGKQVNATNNWWGNASGPTDNIKGDGSTLDSNPNGKGSAAVGAVLYSPWCTLADCSTLSNVVPGTPTGLSAKFQYDKNNLPSGTVLNTTSKPSGNNLELQWNTPAGWVNGYHILTTYPNGSTNTGYQGPNTNAWLVQNGFGQHGQGKYTFRVVAVNNSGQSAASAPFTLIYDTTLPSGLTNLSPANGTFTNTANLTRIDWTAATDPYDAVAYFYESSSSPATNPNGSFTYPVYQSGPLNTNSISTLGTPAGIYYWHVRAVDTAGNSTPWTDAWKITVDNNPPVTPTNLQVKYQYDRNYLNNGTTVWTLSKPGPYKGNNLVLTWNDQSGDWVTGHHVFVTWPDGSTHTIYQGPNTNNWLISQDGFGAHGEGKYTFRVVAANPNGSSTTSSTFSLYYVNHIPTAAFAVQPPKFVNGNFKVTVVAKDDVMLQNVGVDVRTANNPNNGKSWVAGCTTDSMIPNTLPVYSDSGSGVTVTYTCTVNTSHLVNGTVYTLRANASDNTGHGNVNNDKYWQFTFENVPPAVPGAALQDSNGKNITNGYINTQHFTFNLSDTSKSVTSYQLLYWNSITGSSFNGKNHAWYSNLNGYSPSLGVYNDQFTQGEGTHYFAFSACDAAGNCSAYSAPFAVTYDKTPPTVTVMSPTDYSKPFSVGPTVTVSASDTGSGVYSMSTTVYGSSNNTVSTCNNAPVAGSTTANLSCDLSSLPNGTYSFVASATDNAGNTTTLLATSFSVNKVTQSVRITAANVHTPNTGNNNSNSNGSNSQSQNSTNGNTNSNNSGHVLGAHTVTASTASPVNNKATNTKNAAATFLGFAWYWWVLVVLAILAFLFGVLRHASTDNTSGN